MEKTIYEEAEQLKQDNASLTEQVRELKEALKIVHDSLHLENFNVGEPQFSLSLKIKQLLSESK